MQTILTIQWLFANEFLNFSANKINKEMHNSVTESINSILTKRINFHRIILYTCLFVDMAINCM